MPPSELQTGRAFQELLDFLRQADMTFLDPAKKLGEASRVAGYRHLAHLLSYGIDCYLESDPLRPAFIPLASATKKILGDNTDSVYHFTQIRGDHTYCISGIRGNDCYLGFTVYEGKPDGEWSDRVRLNINHRQIEFGPDGSFRIVLSPDNSKGGGYQLSPDCVCVIVRQYFFEPEKASPAILKIENLDETDPPAPLSDDQLARRFRAVATFMRETLQVVPLPADFSSNALGEPFKFSMDRRSWGTPDNIYSIGTFKLGEDEALVISGRSPECAYWGVQTWNHYMQSNDYRFHRVSLNSRQIETENDGSFKLVVALADHGFKNWVGTGGHDSGIVFCRWLLSEGMPARPETALVKISDIV